MRHSLRSLRTTAGFTLIEACTALGITATLASQALPAVSGLLQNQRTAAYADRLAVDLREARSMAIHHNQTIHLSFEAKGTAQCYVVFAGSGDCKCFGTTTRCEGGATALKTVSITDQHTLSYWANKQRIAFSAGHGFAGMASVSVLDANGNGIKHVVAITGRVRSCSLNVSRSQLPMC